MELGRGEVTLDCILRGAQVKEKEDKESLAVTKGKSILGIIKKITENKTLNITMPLYKK